MENPLSEVDAVVKGLVESVNATEQKALLEKVFTSNASFDHPLCTVNTSENSRKRILSIYQWLRIEFSPRIEIVNKAFDEENLVLFIDCAYVITSRSSFKSIFHDPHTRLTTTLFLKRTPWDTYVITRQEDRYQSQDIANIFPGLSTLVVLLKHIATALCIFLAYLAQIFLRRWRP